MWLCALRHLHPALFVPAFRFALLCSRFVGNGSHVRRAGGGSAGWKSPQHNLTGAALGLSAGVPRTQPRSWTICLNQSICWTRASTRADGGSEELELESYKEQNDKNNSDVGYNGSGHCSMLSLSSFSNDLASRSSYSVRFYFWRHPKYVFVFLYNMREEKKKQTFAGMCDELLLPSWLFSNNSMYWHLFLLLWHSK